MPCDCQVVTPAVLKWCFYIANSLTLVSSFSAIVFAAIIIGNISALGVFLREEDSYPAIYVLITQCITFLVGAWALLGGCTKSTYNLYFTSLLNFLLCVVQLVGIVGTFVRKNFFRGGLLYEMEYHASIYYLPNYGGDDIAKMAWDNLQINYFCCGIRSPSDWSTYRPEMQGLPASCICSPIDKHCGPNNYFNIGCYSTLEPFLIHTTEAMAAISIFVVIFQISTAILSIKLAKSFLRRDSEQISLVD